MQWQTRIWTGLLILGVLFSYQSFAFALEPVSLSTTESRTLDGAWELRLGEEGDDWRVARVPGNLTFQGFSFDGIAWFKDSFSLPADWADRDAAVRIPMAANAYELFVNGVKLGGRGQIGPAGELVEKDFRSIVLRIPRSLLKASEPNTVALRVRTFYGNGGVMDPGTLIGPEEIVREDHERRGMRAALLVSLFTFSGFFHLVLFAGRRRERHHFWFALLCVALGSITAGINTMGYLVWHNPDFNAYLVFVPILTLPLLIVAFWASFFGHQRSRLEVYCRWLAIVGSAWLVLTTAYNPLYRVFEGVIIPACIVAMLAALGVGLAWTIAAQRRGQRGANVILFGVAVYALSASLELAWSFRVIDFYVDSYLGFAALVASMVIAIASRFSWLHERAELGERDQLTLCLTRHGFREPLRAACESHDRGNGELSCIIVDLDHFKQINDEYGHTVGDRVLAAVGRAVSGALRGSDLVARWGGEEFLILLPGQGRAAAVEIAERVLAAVRSLRFDDLPDLECSASFGVATRDSQERFEDWLERADRALYEAKDAGRSCVRAA